MFPLIRSRTSASVGAGAPAPVTVLGMPDVTHVIPPSVLDRIDVPEDYLGAAEALRLRLLKADS